MAVRIMDDGHATRAVMYDSVTDWSIGPIADECEGCGMDAIQVLEHFQEWALGLTSPGTTLATYVSGQ